MFDPRADILPIAHGILNIVSLFAFGFMGASLGADFYDATGAETLAKLISVVGGAFAVGIWYWTWVVIDALFHVIGCRTSYEWIRDTTRAG